MNLRQNLTSKFLSHSFSTNFNAKTAQILRHSKLLTSVITRRNQVQYKSQCSSHATRPLPSTENELMTQSTIQYYVTWRSARTRLGSSSARLTTAHAAWQQARHLRHSVQSQHSIHSPTQYTQQLALNTNTQSLTTFTIQHAIQAISKQIRYNAINLIKMVRIIRVVCNYAVVHQKQ